MRSASLPLGVREQPAELRGGATTVRRRHAQAELRAGGDHRFIADLGWVRLDVGIEQARALSVGIGLVGESVALPMLQALLPALSRADLGFLRTMLAEFEDEVAFEGAREPAGYGERTRTGWKRLGSQ